MDWIISLDHLPSFTKAFWKEAASVSVFAFHGQMGAGKTTLIEALCREKGVRDVMGSPTFSIINEYVFEEGGSERSIYHMDLYRLKNDEEVIQAGVEDCIYSGGICFVEWPEKAPWLFESGAAHVFIDVVSESERKVNLRFHPEMQ